MKKKEKYRCKVVDIDNRAVYIDYPLDSKTNKTLFLIDGTQLRATYTEESKAIFAFNTEVLGRKKGQIPMIKLLYPGDSELIKIQRRDFVRVNYAVDISVEFEDERFQFVTDDISAGGSAIIIKGPIKFNQGDEVSVLLPLCFNNGDIKYVSTIAEIVRIWTRGAQTLASLKFTDTDDFDKQQIVRYCFERQLYLRNKGL